MKPASPLAALTLAAASLPAFAVTQPAETSVSMGVSNYREADIPSSRVGAGDGDRYDIDVRQFRLLTPVGRRWSLDVAVSKEVMSGASPWGTVAGPDGKPTLIMSGATIRDSRTEVGVSATRYGDDASTTVTLARSKENDYEARALALSGEWTFDDDLTTLSAGLGYSSDTVEPTDAAAFGRVEKERRRSRSASLGAARVLDRSSAVHVGASVTEHAGYLSDPYKLRDVRPEQRREWVLGVRYRRFLDSVGAALHADYRYYRDDWGIESQTLHASWYQDVWGDFRIVPNVRYYSQSEADFWRPVDDFALPLDTAQSSDFRLSAYGAFTFGLKGILRQPTWSVTVGADRYVSGAKYGLAADAPHPARLSFTLVSVVFDIKF